MQKVRLEYFDIRGRAEPIRLLLHDAGIAFDDVNIAFDDNWSERKGDHSRYLFGQLPICEIDGLVLAQCGAISRYIARRVGYTSHDIAEEAYADMLGCHLDDMINAYAATVNAQVPAEEKKAQLIELVTVTLPKGLDYIEQVFCKRTSCVRFLAYEDRPCFSEFALLYHLLACRTLRPSILDEFPGLTKWLGMMTERKGIKEYIESGKMRFKINVDSVADQAIC